MLKAIVFDCNGVLVDDLKAHEDAYLLVAKKNLVFSDVQMVLASLAKRYLLALLSNTTRDNFNGVFPATLFSLFRETLFADEVENPKPSPEPLLKITRKLKVRKEECCHVGDSLLDMQMSKAAGISVYGVATGHNE